MIIAYKPVYARVGAPIILSDALWLVNLNNSMSSDLLIGGLRFGGGGISDLGSGDICGISNHIFNSFSYWISGDLSGFSSPTSAAAVVAASGDPASSGSSSLTESLTSS
jgi:hypothetical protein